MNAIIYNEGIAIRGSYRDEALAAVENDYMERLQDLEDNFWTYQPQMTMFDEGSYMMAIEGYYDDKLARFVFRCYVEEDDDGSLYLESINAEGFYGF